MALNADTAYTTDADFFAVAGEQEVQTLLREAGESDYSKVHKKATNHVRRWLMKDGIDPDEVDPDHFEEVLVYCTLARIYRGEFLSAPNDDAYRVKAEAYKELCEGAYQVARATIDFASTSDDESIAAAAVPLVWNYDEGDIWGEPSPNVGRTHMNDLDGHDDRVLDGE